MTSTGEDAVHRTKVRIVEDALDANNTIARANREDFDRAGLGVVNLMSAPGGGKTMLLERAQRHEPHRNAPEMTLRHALPPFVLRAPAGRAVVRELKPASMPECSGCPPPDGIPPQAERADRNIILLGPATIS
jgi:hypothetical protein